MKATELRIFNLIQRYNDQAKTYDIITVYEINEEEVNGLKSNLREGEGIPLTEDWLLRFGLQKDVYHPSLDFEFIYRDENRQFIITKNKDGYWTFHIEGLYEGIIDLGKTPFVHRIQNIAHALTGNELTLIT